MSLQLSRDPHGRLVLVGADGTVHEGVVPVRAFPLTAPRAGVSLVGTDGHECAWIPDLDGLDAAPRALIEAELAGREFTPEIRRITGVNTFATPSTWQVETDRGASELVLKAEEDIRRLADGSLLITDSHGIGFRIRDRFALDRKSRAILERFL